MYNLTTSYNHHRLKTIKRVYDLDLDLNLSVLQNAEKLLAKEPSNVLRLSSTTNNAFHNLLLSHIHLPTSTKSLLGLGLKFGIEPPKPKRNFTPSFLHFK